jgi:tRNA pseudouridine13 synthase
MTLENLKRSNDSDIPPAKKFKLPDTERASNVVQESQVGITAYINEENRTDGGFYGTLKSLYSDFQVNEIDTNGNVVHLIDEGIETGPSKKERRAEKRLQEKAEFEGKTQEEINAIKLEKEAQLAQQPKYVLSDSDREKLLTLITEKELSEIEQLFTTGNNMETTTKFDDKQVRGQLHQLLRTGFQGKLESVTTPENTFRIAIAKTPNKKRGHPQESMHHVDENGVLNYGLGKFKPYLHFTLYKENRETMEVASTISKFLRIPSKSINFAGTKDRRGVTCQRFSISKGKVVRVNSLNKAIKGTMLGGFSYEDYPLKLGELKGNEFLITIRDVKAVKEGADVKEVIDKCFHSLQKKGFINYFGMQRFGSFSISTHQLGIKLLQEDWKATAELILSEQETVPPDSVESRRIWAETQNPSLALKKMPYRYSAEHSILKVLEKEKLDKEGEYSQNSYFKAIMQIPKNLRLMYSHAYQSYIWNLVATKRFELFGLEVQEGDLVEDDSIPEVTKDEDGEDFEEDVAVSTELKVKPVTKEDIESGKYTIYDVLLPTPGYKIVYPKNEEILSVYVETMAKDNLDPFKMARRVKEFSLGGSYRKLMTKPENLAYDIVNYEDEGTPIVRTDLEMLTLKKGGQEQESRIIKPETAGSKIAIILKMQLGVSSYATMAMREFMKIDTSRFSFLKQDGKEQVNESEKTS